MIKNYNKRYSSGILNNHIANYISNDQIFEHSKIKNKHLTQHMSYGANPIINGDNT